jgi:hypothetical protein
VSIKYQPRLDMGCEGLSGCSEQGFLRNSPGQRMAAAEEALDDVNICSSAVNQR